MGPYFQRCIWYLFRPNGQLLESHESLKMMREISCLASIFFQNVKTALLTEPSKTQCTVGQTAAKIESYIFVWPYKGSKTDSKK